MPTAIGFLNSQDFFQKSRLRCFHIRCDCGSLALSGMPPPVCSKCRQVDALEGDTWCLGCSAWEALGRELTGHWSVPGARLVVSCTRQVRAMRGFSAGLAQRGEATSNTSTCPSVQSRGVIRRGRGGGY